MKQLTGFMNREIPTDANLSGYRYVACRPKGGGKLGKIPIMSPKHCGHTNRICVDCADEWYDHVILWDRTVGGRRLKAELDQRNNPPAS